MKFKVINTYDNADVLGGAVSEDNAFVQLYASYHDKHYLDLKVGESCLATFKMSSQTPVVHKVVRVE